jgi:hypothetical protein
MIDLHPDFAQPKNPKAAIWRYMDLAKFVRLLQTRRLYFARSDLLGDKFEGSNTLAAHHWADRLSQPDQEVELGKLWPNMSATQARGVLQQLRLMRIGMRTQVFVSCWHLSDVESAAMWSLYGGNNASVAIRVPYASLARALPSGVMMGTVKYLSWDRELFNQGNLLAPFIHKRSSFKHENEVRAIIELDYYREKTGIEGLDATKPGVEVAIDLSAILNGVFVSPAAPEWFEEVVSDLCAQYGIMAPVKQSELSSMVVY